MASKKIKDNEEIDLVEIVLILWRGKWKIIFITFLSCLLMYTFQSYRTVRYEATTEIKPISAFEEFKYETYNSFIEWRNEKTDNSENISIENKFFFDSKDEELPRKKSDISFERIDKLYLLNLFIDAVKDNQLLEDEIKRVGLIKRKNYSDDVSFNNAVTKMASSITIKILENKKNTDKIPQWAIKFNTDDQNNWEIFLKNLESSANIKVQNHLQSSFEEVTLSNEKIRKYKIEDINELIDQAIKNYETDVENKIVVLEEQAAIAKELGIVKNTIQNNNLINDTEDYKLNNISLYLKGYEVLEKEIQLIKSRNNKQKRAFTKNLDILIKDRNKLISNKDSPRTVELFRNTPIMNSENFYAGIMQVNKTVYDTARKATKTMLIFSGLLGFLLGLMYVIFESAIKNRKEF